jgi:hypothetical protein
MSNMSNFSPELRPEVQAVWDTFSATAVDDDQTKILLERVQGLVQHPPFVRPRSVPSIRGSAENSDLEDSDPVNPVVESADSDADSVAEVVGVGVGTYQVEADDVESSGIDLDRSFSTPGIIEDFEDLKEGLFTLEKKSASHLIWRDDDLVIFTRFVELVGRLKAEMGDRDANAKSLIAALNHKAEELARRLHEQTGVNQGLTTELHAVRTAVQVQTTRANGAEARNLQLQAKVVQLEARNDQLKATVGGFVTGVTGLLTLIQSDLEARLRKINPIYDVNSPGQMLYRIEGLRQDGNTKLASYVEELIRKHQALSSAKAAMEQNPSVQSLNTAFNTLLNSAAVRKSHTGFRAVFGLESATHQKIAKQASAFRTLYPNANVAQPAAHADR